MSDRKLTLLLATALFLVSAPEIAKAELTSGYLQVDGIQRHFLFHVPAALDSPAPLVFILHGHGATAALTMGENARAAPYRRWLHIAERENLVLVIPDGSIGPNGMQGWNDCRMDAFSNPSTDDVKFISQIISSFSQQGYIDPLRVYVTGTSNGGQMALRLAMELPNQIAAAAPVGAAMAARNECATPKPKPILFCNGTADPILPYQGGRIPGFGRGTIFSVEDSVQFWVNLNQLSPQAAIQSYPDLDSGDSSTVDGFSYGLNQKNSVEFLRVEGGGHTDPSLTEQYSSIYLKAVGPQNHDVELAEYTWFFFQDKTL